MNDDVLPGFRRESVVEDGIEYEVRVFKSNGDRYWYLNGCYHRVQVPAIERVDGHRSWYRNGKLHREDGPAFVGVQKCDVLAHYESWHWHGVRLTKEVREQGIDQLSPEEIRFWLPILAAQESK